MKLVLKLYVVILAVRLSAGYVNATSADSTSMVTISGHVPDATGTTASVTFGL